MTPLALQRVAVRMLFDPAFAKRVREEPNVALAGLDATEAECGWLGAPDLRAWATDPFRRARALKGLLEEFPATAALLGVVGLDAFFSSAEFHDAVQDGASVALAFGEWIRRRSPDMGELELAISRARRPPEWRDDTGRHGVFTFPRGSSFLHARDGLPDARGAILEALGADPVAALVERDAVAEPLPASDAKEWLLVLPAHGGPRIERLPEALGAALARVRFPSREELLAALRAEGAEPGDDEQIVEDLLRDGLLVRV